MITEYIPVYTLYWLFYGKLVKTAYSCNSCRIACNTLTDSRYFIGYEHITPPCNACFRKNGIEPMGILIGDGDQTHHNHPHTYIASMCKHCRSTAIPGIYVKTEIEEI